MKWLNSIATMIFSFFSSLVVSGAEADEKAGGIAAEMSRWDSLTYGGGNLSLIQPVAKERLVTILTGFRQKVVALTQIVRRLLKI